MGRHWHLHTGAVRHGKVFVSFDWIPAISVVQLEGQRMNIMNIEYEYENIMNIFCKEFYSK